MLSELVWIAIFVVAFVWEMIGVFYEKQTKIEPLTTLTRDRLMRKRPWYYAILFFWVWLGFHFFLEAPPPWHPW